MKKLKLNSELMDASRLRNSPSITEELRLVRSGTEPTGSRPAKTYVEAFGKNEGRVEKIRPAEHVEHGVVLVRQVFLRKFADLGKLDALLARKNRIQITSVRQPS